MVRCQSLIVARVEPVERQRRLSGPAALRGRGQVFKDQVVVVDHRLHVLAHGGPAADPDDVVASLHLVEVPRGAGLDVLGRPMREIATKRKAQLREDTQ